MSKDKFKVAAGMALAAVTLVACSTGGGDLPESTVGGALELNLPVARVEMTLTSAEVHTTGPEEYVKPKGEFVVADVSIDVKSGIYAANPYNFTLVLRDGTRVETTGGWFEPAMHVLDVPAGQVTSGKVTFDVPVGVSQGSKLAVTYGLADQGYWLFG